MAQLTDQFFKTILQIEGGYQAHPADTGNYCGGVLVGTKFGMSAIAVSDWLGRCPTPSEMKNFTEQDAKNFYAWYFHRSGLYQIENQQFFELLANNTMGSFSNAVRVEQRVLNSLGYSLSVDGVRGPLTISALNEAYRKYGVKLYNAIREAWVQYLYGLNNPTFIEGWIKRMDKYFPPLAVAAAGGSAVLILLLIALLWPKKNGQP